MFMGNNADAFFVTLCNCRLGVCMICACVSAMNNVAPPAPNAITRGAGTRKKRAVTCNMRALTDCLDTHDGQISQCVREVDIFERTCDKRLDYVHDRLGLDDSNTGLFGNKKAT